MKKEYRVLRVIFFIIIILILSINIVSASLLTDIYGLFQNIFDSKNGDNFKGDFFNLNPESIGYNQDPYLFSIKTCKDVLCKNESTNFLKNQIIYVNYSSNYSLGKISGTITYPTENIEYITIPTRLKYNQSGTYIIEAVAKKDNYQSNQMAIFIIDEEKINPVLRIDINNPVNDSENLPEQTNPNQDEIPINENSGFINKTNRGNIIFYAIIFSIIAIMIVISFVIFNILNKKEEAVLKYIHSKK